MTTFQTHYKWLLSLSLLLIMVACTPTSGEGIQVDRPTPTGEPTAQPVDNETLVDASLVGTDWDLISLDGADVESVITLNFTETEVGGSDGCNSFGTTYEVTGNQLIIGNEMMSTLVACLDNDVMEQADLYMQALQTAVSFTQTNNQLIIQTENGELVFEKPQTATLSNTRWQLTGLSEGDMAISQWEIDRNIHFQIDGTQVSGSGGCNRFDGSVTIQEAQLTFNDIAFTEMACMPADVNTRETAFFIALNKVANYEIVRQSLSLYDENGALIGTFSAEVDTSEEVSVEPTDISQIRWTLQHTVVGGDALVTPPTNSVIFLQIEEDEVFGNAGCNNFNGSVEINGDELRFGSLISTRMACGDTINSYETAFLELLEKVTHFATDDMGRLALFGDGVWLAQLTPSETITLFVGAEEVDCVGVAPQTCLLIKENPEDEYSFFYDQIAGFAWEAGYEYELLVGITEVAEPPADTSSLQYALVEVVSQTAVDTPATETASELAGTTWQWTAFEDPSGLNNLVINTPANYTITFLEDGTYTLQNDCNAGGGSYTQQGSQLTIETLESEEEGCEEPSLAPEFSNRLMEVVTFVMNGDQLFLNLIYDSGNLVFQRIP